MSIPYGRQEIVQDDIDAVTQVLRGDFLTQGDTVPAFESAVATRCGARNAVAVNSATSALHLAVLALGVGSGDWVWTSPITFVASSNCALYCGARVDFVDIDPRTYNMSLIELEKKLVIAKDSNRLPKVVIAVHLAGQSCDMHALAALSEKYGFKIIEDASHAIGGEYQGRPIGNCDFSAVTIFSFHPVKLITSGEGGMALTQSDELAARIRLLRSHGITRDPSCMSRSAEGPWYYEQVDLGFNYRMTDILAALGMSQMRRLDVYLARRRELAAQYDQQLEGVPVIRPFQASYGRSGLHLYIVRLRLDKIAGSHLQVFKYLRRTGIGVNLHYIPVYRQPYYSRFGFDARDFPNAESYYREAISLPLYPALRDDQQRYVIEELAAACGSRE